MVKKSKHQIEQENIKEEFQAKDFYVVIEYNGRCVPAYYQIDSEGEMLGDPSCKIPFAFF